MAVAEVLARYLWDYPRRPGDTEILPRQLKDTASRALSGKLLSKAALGLFIEAFGIRPDVMPASETYFMKPLVRELVEAFADRAKRLEDKPPLGS